MATALFAPDSVFTVSRAPKRTNDTAHNLCIPYGRPVRVPASPIFRKLNAFHPLPTEKNQLVSQQERPQTPSAPQHVSKIYSFTLHLLLCRQLVILNNGAGPSRRQLVHRPVCVYRGLPAVDSLDRLRLFLAGVAQGTRRTQLRIHQPGPYRCPSSLHLILHSDSI
ncbi:unnamed protein product [Chondrus crispus]|uniref:Uncharacterized protein n=1 Tax=Chondrus crispus TaxID=2769 RepID=R7QFY0_CHOCR|nr:unnamed protein product [Chondrus crispus]CDF36330.1 unnamed protein product [Chondrus crispus]|eukprot:XP_005716149.1 unnamed protein product [Chondrus crispus]